MSLRILVDRIRRIRTFKDEGKAAFNVGKYNVAIEKYTDATKVDPGNKAVRTPSYLNRELALYKDHYGILGIERNPTVTEFRAAYKKLSLETHPDRGGDEERFKEIKASYEFLTDERRRERYDQGDSDAEGPDYEDLFGADGIPFFFFFFFLNDLLNSYTRGGGRGRGGARGHKS
ncbi:hypothetical protein Rt10032_c03g1685 [Rhodotorula toruloides]|uniref:J domain-containing protein n=1 Tax=Rhodotorula toruloides TaxID=5286 RepID=A0A511KBB4_RHOTO|nr:hypothetical protein Rt10032_c03g1685 [Rhodotorula toruloides]